MGGALLGGYIASEFYVHNIKTYDSSIAEMLDNHCAGGIARNMIHKYTFNVDKAHDFLKEIYDGESYMFGGKAKNVAMAYIELVDKQHPAIARAIGKNKEFYDFLEKMLCWGCNATDHLVTLRNMSLHAVLTPDVYVD